MTDHQAKALEQARQAVDRSPDSLVADLIERIGGRAGVQAVFGTAIDHGDLTIVPVARVRWGFGGGAGRAGPSEQGESAATASASGSGGGGGVAADPVGYLEISADGARFRPIAQPYPSSLFLLASGLTAAIVIGAIGRVIRR